MQRSCHRLIEDFRGVDGGGICGSFLGCRSAVYVFFAFFINFYMFFMLFLRIFVDYIPVPS